MNTHLKHETVNHQCLLLIYHQVLRQLKPRTFGNGADLLGAHTEGPWLNPAKRGAHGPYHIVALIYIRLTQIDETLMRNPMHFSMEAIYGDAETVSAIKLLTLAPELQGSLEMIELISKKYGIIVSLGHSAADLDTGVAAIKAGAKALTHVFNATNPLHHRSPGLVGLMSSSEAPYYSVIPDGIHLHPTVLAMAFRASPEKCILITDSIELAGMPDGIYPGHSQIPHSQNKEGLRATIAGTDTLIGSCISIDECVRNLKEWSGCTLPQAVRCVTENVVGLMQNTERGLIQPGRRGDFVVLDDEGNVLQTWIKGAQIYER